MSIQDIIRKKRDGGELSPDDIATFIRGIDDWSIGDGQIAALLMACQINGMSENEVVRWIEEAVKTGMVFNWDTDAFSGPVAAMHALPGVGDKIEILAAPVLAACGVYVPMICDRMQYHTGGTLDKLESIMGYDSRPSHGRFRKALREAGCAFMSSTDQFAPVAIRIQDIRDITATLASLPLMVASMLTKKVVSGIKKLTVDLKVGSGSFTKTKEDADRYRELLDLCAPHFGIETAYTYSDMDRVVGQNIGTALEIYEIWAYLTGALGPRDADLHELVRRVCGCALMQNGLAKDQAEAYAKVDEAVSSGRAAERFGMMLSVFGVSPAFMRNPSPFLNAAPVVKPVYPDTDGTVESMNMRWIGLTVLQMGAGRMYQEEKIDFSAGFTNVCKPGMYVSKQIPLAFVHACDEETADEAITHLKGAIVIAEA